jgi:hypothetical protein
LESWVGADRAKEIKLRMSEHSKTKGEFLRSLNLDRDYLEKRRASRRVHENIVAKLVCALRAAGAKCFILSEHVKEERTPDAIVFDGHRLIAVEVEQEKKYKPSHAAITERLSTLNAKSDFFDETFVLFVPEGETAEESVARGLRSFPSKD